MHSICILLKYMRFLIWQILGVLFLYRRGKTQRNVNAKNSAVRGLRYSIIRGKENPFADATLNCAVTISNKSKYVSQVLFGGENVILLFRHIHVLRT